MSATSDHPCFLQPTDTNATIWRYMDFTKFVSLLESGSLYFCRADRLGDPFEGSVSQGNIIHRPEIYSTIPEQQREYVISQTVEFRKRLRSRMYINCWHMNKYESAAMWKLYSTSNAAVAISSKYSSLLDAFDKDTYIGMVNYADYSNAVMPENNLFWPFMFKRVSFSHEREVRAVCDDMTGKQSVQDGVYKQISLQKLIDIVHVSPDAPSWYFELVKKVVAKYELSIPVMQSSLTGEPVY